MIDVSTAQSITLNGSDVLRITEGGDVLWDKMTHIDYLCFTDVSGSSNTLKLTKEGGVPAVSLEYSTDKVNWTTWTETNNVRTYNIPANGKVYLRGDNATFNTTTDTKVYRFSSSGDINASGDLTTLLNKFATETLPEGAFNCLFRDMTTLKSVPKLIATTLGEKCYGHLFAGCTGLTDASSISIAATNLPVEACVYMFSNCSNLTTPPTFTSSPLTIEHRTFYAMFYKCGSLTTAPSFTISTINGTSACESMFEYCTSLTSASNITLNATTIPDSAYAWMFDSCTSLTTPPTMTSSALTIGGSGLHSMFGDCTALTSTPTITIGSLVSGTINHCLMMFKGCTSLKTANMQLNATTLYKGSYQSMFIGCSRLVTPPEIMATTLYGDEYYGSLAYMFSNCSSLSSIKVHFTNWNSGNSTSNWTRGTKSTGTFYKPSSLPSTKNASGNKSYASYIPYDWTVIDI